MVRFPPDRYLQACQYRDGGNPPLLLDSSAGSSGIATFNLKEFSRDLGARDAGIFVALMDDDERQLLDDHLRELRYEARRIPWLRLVAYAIATFIGAVSGYGIGFLLFGCRT